VSFVQAEFIINQNFVRSCFQSKVSSVRSGWYEEESKVI